MEILKFVGLGLITLILYLLLQENKKQYSVLLLLASGAIIFLALIGPLNEVLRFINTIAARANISTVYIGIVLKILAIAYLASFCTELCKDAGAESIGTKVEFAGKILILALAVPILMAVLDSILQIL
ncbi:MAG: stage III sporulation protein AD [Clostridium sp.]